MPADKVGTNRRIGWVDRCSRSFVLLLSLLLSVRPCARSHSTNHALSVNASSAMVWPHVPGLSVLSPNDTASTLALLVFYMHCVT